MKVADLCRSLADQIFELTQPPYIDEATTNAKFDKAFRLATIWRVLSEYSEE